MSKGVLESHIASLAWLKLIFDFILNKYKRKKQGIESLNLNKPLYIHPDAKFVYNSNIKLKKYPFWRLDTLFSSTKHIDLNVIKDGGWHFTNLKTPDEMYEKFMNFGHHDSFRLSGLTIEKIRDKILNKEMFYDHFADMKSTNKWQSNYKLKLVNEKLLPKFLIDNKIFNTYYRQEKSELKIKAYESIFYKINKANLDVLRRLAWKLAKTYFK